MKKMKNWMGALCLLAMLAVCAYAQAEISESDTRTPREGIAVAAPASMDELVPMFDKPDENSDILMEYYSGTILTVTRLAGAMVQVQCGEQGASLMGYMRMDDLRYGAQAMREVPRCQLGIEIRRDTNVYAYCDEGAQTIGRCKTTDFVSAVGRNADQWVQLCPYPYAVWQKGDWYSAGPEKGFVHMTPGVGIGTLDKEEEGPYMVSRFVLPLESEMTYEEALSRAIELILENPEKTRIPEQYMSREALEEFRVDIRLTYMPDNEKIYWEVSMELSENIEYNARIQMSIDGELEDIESSNG